MIKSLEAHDHHGIMFLSQYNQKSSISFIIRQKEIVHYLSGMIRYSIENDSGLIQ